MQPYASLRFEYEDRPDWAKGYSAGSPVSNLKRLKFITSCLGEQVARTYTLGYTTRTTANSRSLLTSLTEAGSDGKAYPDLTFEYEDPTCRRLGGPALLHAHRARANQDPKHPTGSRPDGP